MRDPRLDRLADVIVNYSCKVKSGDVVGLSSSPIAQPLIEALYEALIKAGAHVRVNCVPDSLAEILYKHASDEQLDHTSPLALHEMENLDVRIAIWAETNTRAMSNIDPVRQGRAAKARRPIMKAFMERAGKGELRWSGTLYPTHASAQDAEMSLADYCDFVFKAGLLDHDDPVAAWLEVERRQQLVVDYLTGSKEIHFQAANGTDLRVNVEGMTWINCCGHENFPDGEVFPGPNAQAADGGVNGIVRYSFPAVHNGRGVEGIELEFEKGRVVKASASSNEDFLLKMLDMDEGARSLGEIAIGTNYQIRDFSRNTLFDEKIGGTFHAAVGAGYPESGNCNESGLHWDMVCDLRPGGTITVDGTVISRDGQFLFPDWPGLDPDKSGA
jgi:aminopeptidase